MQSILLLIPFFWKRNIFEETDQDKWMRTIAKVYYDDNLYISAEIIKVVMEWWYYRYFDDESLGELENQAIENKRGLWQDSHAIAL